jgi:hypothetical protein
MKDTLLQIRDSSVLSTNSNVLNKIQELNSNFNWLLLFSIIELVIILVLIIKLKSKDIKVDKFDEFRELKNAKNSDIDMNNLMNSINYSRNLYKELSRKCHPDRFESENDKNVAQQIFQEITRHKHNHKILLELKEKAIEKLNISF